MKQVLAFDIDQTLNELTKTPIPDYMSKLLTECLEHFEVALISGQKFDQFLVQIVDPMVKNGATPSHLEHLHLFVTQGTQYFRYNNGKTWKKGPVSVTVTSDKTPYDAKKWESIYDYPLTKEQVSKIFEVLEKSAKELGFWEEDKLQEGDEIIEDRHAMVAFSALGQKADAHAKHQWDQDHKKRDQIVARAKELAPEFTFEVGGTTTINVSTGATKEFGMTHLLKELDVTIDDILYFGDMTQPGGNDYPVVKMGIDTITVRNCEDTAYALRGILGIL